MIAPSSIAAIVLAGGQARRIGGGDKGRVLVGDRSILARTLATVRPQVAAVAVNANGEAARFADLGLPVLPDTMADAGPLAGMLAGLDWAARKGFPWLLTVPGDTPFLPADLTLRLGHALRDGGTAAVAGSGGRSHPVVGLWSSGLAEPLRRFLEEGKREAGHWAKDCGAAVVEWPDLPCDSFFNVNSPTDRQQAEALAAIPIRRAGTVLLPKGRSAHRLLADFAANAKRRGIVTGGLLQRGGKSEGEASFEVAMIALDTGESFPILQRLGRDACCAVDTQEMVAATAALRRALAAPSQLVIVNKFGPLEAKGGGLADEMTAIMAEGLPLLTTVAEARLDAWLAFCGGLCELLPAEMETLWRWWERNGH